MSTVNIHNAELRQLLNRMMIEGDENDPFIQNLTHMEAAIILTQEPIYLPSTEAEARMVHKLQQQFKGSIHLKWFIPILAIITFSLVFYLTRWNNDAKHSDEAIAVQGIKPQPEQHSVPVMEDSASDKTTTVHPQKEIQVKPEITETREVLVPQKPEPIPAYTAQPQTPEPVYAENVAWSPSSADTLSIDTFFTGVSRVEIYGKFFPVNVTVSSSDLVTLKGEMNAKAKGRKANKLNFFPKYERQGTVLKVTVESNQKNFIGSLEIHGYLNFQIPAESDLVIENKSGGITINGMKGKVCQISSSYGSVSAEDISTDLTTGSSSGNITIGKVKGNVTANAAYGNLRFSEITGNLKTKASSGNITLSGLTGDLELISNYGNVQISKLTGNMNMKAGSGDVDIESTNGKTCLIDASYGNVNLNDMTSEITVHSKSGSVRCRKITGNVNVKSAYGPVTLDGVNGRMKTDVSSGEVTVSNSEGQVEIYSAYGNVELSKCKGNMDIRAQSGSIRLSEVSIPDTLKMYSGYGNIRFGLLNDVNDLSYELETAYGEIAFMKEEYNSGKDKRKIQIIKGRVIVKAYTQSGQITVN